MAFKLFNDSFDLHEAEDVHITIDQNSEGVQVWIDVDGYNRGRVYRIKTLAITDRRKEKAED